MSPSIDMQYDKELMLEYGHAIDDALIACSKAKSAIERVGDVFRSTSRDIQDAIDLLSPLKLDYSWYEEDGDSTK